MPWPARAVGGGEGVDVAPDAFAPSLKHGEIGHLLEPPADGRDRHARVGSELAHRRPAAAGTVGIPGKAGQQPAVRRRRQGGVILEWNGRRLKTRVASGVAAQPARKRLILGVLCRCTPKGLAKIGEVGEARCRQTYKSSPDFTEYADPPSEAGFAFQGSGFAVSATCTRTIPRTSRAWRAARCSCKSLSPIFAAASGSAGICHNARYQSFRHPAAV